MMVVNSELFVLGEKKDKKEDDVDVWWEVGVVQRKNGGTIVWIGTNICVGYFFLCCIIILEFKKKVCFFFKIVQIFC